MMFSKLINLGDQVTDHNGKNVFCLVQTPLSSLALKYELVAMSYIKNKTQLRVLRLENNPCHGGVMPLPPQSGLFSYNRNVLKCFSTFIPQCFSSDYNANLLKNVILFTFFIATFNIVKQENLTSLILFY